MIRPSKDESKLWFIPPEKSGEQELEFDLVYAHVCPKCNNLVQALFLTDKFVDPKPWEEIMTKILDKSGHYKRIIPGRSDRFNSRYRSTPIGRGTAVSAQLIQFTEHFNPKVDLDNQPICEYVAISSGIPEFRIHDILLALAPPLNPANYIVKDKDYESIRHTLSTGQLTQDWYIFTPAKGNGPEIIFALRKAHQWGLNNALGKFFKPLDLPAGINPF